VEEKLLLSVIFLENYFALLNSCTGRIMQKLLHHGNALKVSGNNLSNLYKFSLQSYSYKLNYYFFG